MKKNPRPPIPIRLVVNGTIPLFSAPGVKSALCGRLVNSLTMYFSAMGVEGSPAVDVQLTENDGRVLEVLVHGLRQPYAPETLRRVWESREPRHMREVSYHENNRAGFPDRWLNKYLRSLDPNNQEAKDSSLEFLSALAYAAIAMKPSALLDGLPLARYIERLNESLQLDAALTKTVLGFLLDQGISIANGPVILESIRQGMALGRTGGDMAEALFARLRRPRFEIIVSPQQFMSLTGREHKSGEISVYSEEFSSESRKTWDVMEAGVFWDTGLYPPDLVWKVDSTFPSGVLAFRTNDLQTEYLPLLAPDELLVNEPPDRLIAFGVAALREIANPVTGSLCSVVSAADGTLLGSTGSTTWEPLGYVVLLTAAEIEKRAAQLFTVDDVAHNLARIRENFPLLVDTTLRRFSVESLARVLRGLLAERISIRNLPFILERLLQYRTIGVDAGSFVVFDDRLPIAPESTALQPESWQSQREFLRSGLKRQITSALLKGRPSIPVFLLDADLERWLIFKNDPSHEDAQVLDDQRDEVRQAIWTQMGSNAGLPPIILTTTEPRAALVEIVGREMPDLQIAAYSELTPDVNLQPIARIAPPDHIGTA